MIEKAKNVCEKNFQSIQMESINASFGPKTAENNVFCNQRKEIRNIICIVHNSERPIRL